MKKKITKDFILNFLSSIVVTSVLQLIVYPILALKYNSNIYGSILTSMGIINTLGSLGNTLNNTRLIMQSEYNDRKIVGDFNILLLFSNIIISIIAIIINSIIFKYKIYINVFLAVYSVLLSTVSYLETYYRIILDFKKILCLNISVAVGYLIGTVIVYFIGIWPIAFVFGQFFGLLFLLKHSDMYKEPYKRTALFNSALKKYIILVLSTLSTSVMVYLDRMIIYPLLGGEAVSNYTIASLFGKILGIIISPMAGVLLGYYTNKKFQLTRKRFWKINFESIMLAIIFIFLANIFAPFAIQILYPGYLDKALKYVAYTNVSAAIGTLASIAQPAALAYAPTKWQLIKETVYGIVYICLGYFLIRTYNLVGFCIAGIFANIVRIIFQYIVGTYYIGIDKKKE